MSSERATADASVLDFRETHSQATRKAADWRVTTLVCECGADITTWHSAAEARRLVRVYGTDGCVPACPDCQSARSGKEDDLASVPKAITKLRGSSSVDRLAPDEQLAVITRPEVE